MMFAYTLVFLWLGIHAWMLASTVWHSSRYCLGCILLTKWSDIMGEE